MIDLKTVESEVKKFRANLDDESRTAKAIDRNDSFEDIALCAREEGHDEFAGQMETAAENWEA